MTNFSDFLANEKSKCDTLLASYFGSNQSERYCPPDFDGYYCWPATPRLTLAQIRCALERQKNESVYRWCSANMTELSGTKVSLWQNAQYEKCLPLTTRQFSSIFSTMSFAIENKSFQHLMVIMIKFIRQFLTESRVYGYMGKNVTNRFQNVKKWWHKKLNVIDEIGLGFSIIFLILALSIFASFSQLQDTRVKIHINLFIAMLLYAVASLTQNLIYGDKMYTILINLTRANNETSFTCRSLMTFSRYYELTTFTWILIEGWYFYSFISQAPYNEYITIKPQIFAGWGLPLIVIIPWIIVHVYSTHTNFCWVDTDIKINIMAIPVLVLILVNLGFFILNVRIIFIKMRSTYMSQKRMDYWRWIKSSLMLVPLFGTYDILYVIWPWVEDEHTKIWLLLSLRVICSFQGCVVSVLYCFANNSVKKEIERAWYNWKLKREIDSQIAKRTRSSENLTKAKVSDQIGQSSKIDFRQPDLYNYF